MENYEKKYKEALEKAKTELKTCCDCAARQMILRLFPDLKKSEDELIREEILNCFVEMKKQGCFPSKHEAQYNSWVSWLEKQSVPASSYDIPKHKFNVGDWIVNKKGVIGNINEIKIDGHGMLRYCINWVDGNQSIPIPCFVDDDYHLWTSKDVKKGDILQANNCTLICDSYTKDIDGNIVISSWYFCDSKRFYGMGISKPDLWSIEGITPATKEQRDFLFQKMYEAGYKWDSNKLELQDIRY